MSLQQQYAHSRNGPFGSMKIFHYISLKATNLSFQVCFLVDQVIIFSLQSDQNKTGISYFHHFFKKKKQKPKFFPK